MKLARQAWYLIILISTWVFPHIAISDETLEAIQLPNSNSIQFNVVEDGVVQRSVVVDKDDASTARLKQGAKIVGTGGVASIPLSWAWRRFKNGLMIVRVLEAAPMQLPASTVARAKAIAYTDGISAALGGASGGLMVASLGDKLGITDFAALSFALLDETEGELSGIDNPDAFVDALGKALEDNGKAFASDIKAPPVMTAR